MRIDLHADTPLWMHWAGYDLCKHHRPWLPQGALGMHVDLPRMQEARLDVQMFGLVALPTQRHGFDTILQMIDTLDDAELRAEGSERTFHMVRTGGDMDRVVQHGGRAGLLCLEGVHVLEGRLDRVDTLIDRGVVAFGLAHFHANAACRPAMGWGRNDAQGLTEFGRELVHYLTERQVLIDLTHINRTGFFDTLTTSPTASVFVSHTGVSGAHPHWRNLDDQQIRAIAQRGGVIGIIFARNFLGGSDLDAVVAHVRHLVRVGGEQVAALGSDFDGFIVPVRGLRDITGLPALAEALRRSGLSTRAVDGIMGDNAARFFRTYLR